MINLTQFKELFPKAISPEHSFNHITCDMYMHDIIGIRRESHYLAQIAHESQGLSKLIESTYYSSAERLLAIFPKDFSGLEDAKKYAKHPRQTANRVYANQNGNGSEETGDGWKYRGRGYIQLSGKDNYAEMGKITHQPLLAYPELVGSVAIASFVSAVWWKAHGLNEIADNDNILSITKIINGGKNGLQDRKEWQVKIFNKLIEQK